MSGNSLSVTVIVCVHVAVLPDASVAVHVTVVAPSAYGSVPSLPELTPGQLSLIVAEPKLTPVAEQVPASVDTLTADGHVITGASLSVTVTVCVHVAVLPDASVAVHVTVVDPSAYGSVPSLLELTPGQLSLIVAVPKLTPVAEH